jgi:exosortase
MIRRFDLRSLALPSLIAILIVMLFHEVMSRLIKQCLNSSDLSYTVFVPLLAGWAAFSRKNRIAGEPVAPDSRGLVLTAIGCIVFLLGRLSAELYSSRCSLFLLLAGLAWTFWGLRRLAILAPPLVILFTIVPLPLIVYNLTAPLLNYLLSGTIALIQQVGISVYSEAGFLQTSRGSLEIARAAGGLRVLPMLVAVIAAWRWPIVNKLALSVATALFLAACISIRTAGVLIWMDQSSAPPAIPGWLFSGWFISTLGLIFLAVMRAAFSGNLRSCDPFPAVG